MTFRGFRIASKWLRWVGVAGLTVSLSGCSWDDCSNEFAARFCALFKPCCAKAGMSGDQSTCKMLYGSARPTSQAAADQCLKDYEALASDPAFCDFSQPEPESCKKAFPESSSGKQPGAACSGGSDCAGDSTCDMNWETDQGTCAAFVLVPEGAACIGERSKSSSSWSGDPKQNQITLCDNDAGLVCSSNVCKQRSQVGQTCSSSHECVDGAYCLGDVCAQQLTAGSACSGMSDECSAETHCAAVSKTCEPRRADGEACAGDTECLSESCSEGVCKYNPGLAGLALGFVCN